MAEELKQDTPVTANTEELSKKEEPKTEELKEPTVEVKTEELKVDNKPSETLAPVNSEVKTEQLKEPNMELNTLNEQLSVVKEVREELAKTYVENKELHSTNEKLSKDIEAINLELSNAKISIENLNKELSAYKAKEDEANRLAYNKRLEKLSADFGSLGQTKTIEQLSSHDIKVIEELEEVVKLALEKKVSEKLDSKIIPTNAMVNKKVEKLSEVKKEVNTKDFMSDICRSLVEQQDVKTKNATRVMQL